MGNIIAITILTFLSVVLLVLGLYGIFTANQRTIKDRMDNYTKENKNIDFTFREEREKVSLKSFFSSASKIFAQAAPAKTLEKELTKADIPLKGEEFILLTLLTSVLPAFAGWLLSGNIGLAIVLSILGLITPKLMVNYFITKRIKQINAQIGDCLTIIANSLRAGYSFIQSMEMVGKEMPDPIAKEFARTFREINLGTPTEEALLNMSSRVGSDDLDLVVTAVLIQRQIGGNLAEIMDNISHTIRERIRIKGEIKTLTAQGRISGLIIALMPPILIAILLVINPAYMTQLFKDPKGLIMIGAGVVSEIFGIMMIKRIIDIEV